MSKSIHAACKVDEGTRNQLDALLPYLSTPYHQATRSDAMRAALTEGIPVLQRRFVGASASSRCDGCDHDGHEAGMCQHCDCPRQVAPVAASDPMKPGKGTKGGGK